MPDSFRHFPGLGDLLLGGKYLARAAEAYKTARAEERARQTGNDRTSRSCNSFTGDTRVLMADGSKKPIKNVKLGDKVMATDPATGKHGPRKVIDLIRHSGRHTMVNVHLAHHGTIKATSGHPFWVANRGSHGKWVNAIGLHSGDQVTTDHGTHIKIAGITIRTEDLRAYNLTIQDLHTYYVESDNTPVLVHNASRCNWRAGFDALADGRQVGSVKVVKNTKALRSLFNEWTLGAQQLPARGPKIPDVFQLQDGTVMQWRTASQSGGETIDIFQPGGATPLKVHIQ